MQNIFAIYKINNTVFYYAKYRFIDRRVGNNNVLLGLVWY